MHRSSSCRLIFICGRNEKLATALRARKSRLPRFVEGFTTKVNTYMQTGGFFYRQAGAGERQRGAGDAVAGDCRA